MIINLIQNAVLLLSLCWLQTTNMRFWGERHLAAQLVSGVLFGLTCMFGMLTPLVLEPGLLVDARSMVLSMAALFGGPLVAGIAGFIAAAYRLWLGGIGMWAGLLWIILAILAGLAYRHLWLHDRLGTGLKQLWAFGLLVQLLDLLPLFYLSASTDMSTLLNMAGITLLVMPLATVWLGVMLKDIARRKQDEQELRIAATAFETQQGMLITDASNRILRVNQAFSAITGYSSSEVVGKKTSLLSSGRHGPAFYQEMWQQLKENDRWQGEIWNRRKNGDIYPEWLSISAVRNARGQVTHYLASLDDITQRKAAEERIQYLAFFDTLTGLPNRSLLLDRLQHAIDSSARSGQFAALMFLDIDGFKNVNDLHGHQIGDKLLCLTAERLNGAVRASDTVARLGGDEFVIMLEGLAGSPEQAASQAEHLAETLLSALSTPYRITSLTLHSSASIGVVLFNDAALSTETLMQHAELSMYEAKAAGKNRVRFFDPRMQDAVSTRLQLEDEIRQGLRSDEFIFYLQPQLNDAGDLLGAELLARWQHPQRGLLGPAAFIGVAEQSGLVEALDYRMLQLACRQLALWRHKPATAALTLSVNLSARLLYQTDFVDRLLRLLALTGANPHRLKLELTETLLLEDLPGAVARMSALKKHGIHFSIDDFGTGYSSMAYLQTLPLDQLKIDQSFVRELPAGANSQAIIRAICALSDSLHLEVIAEGVETEAQFRALQELGCHYFQGYLFGRPMPLVEFERMLVASPGTKTVASLQVASV